MNHSSVCFALLILVSVFNSSVIAQKSLFMGLIESEYEFSAVSDPAGVLDQYNDYIAQYHDGSMLFMGHSGIHVYDGRNIRHISNEIEGNGTAFVVRGVFTRNGTFVSPSNNRYVAMLTDNETFVNVAHYDSIGVRRAILIHGDPHFDDGVVVSTNDGRWIALHIDGRSSVITENSNTGALPPFSIRFGNQRNELWMYNNSGEIWRVLWDGNTWHEEHAVTLPGAGDILVRDGYILVAAASGVYSVTQTSGTDSYTATLWYPARISKFTQTSDGRVHMFSPGVYHLYDGCRFYTKSLPISSHFRIFADREDNIWMPGRDGVDLIRKRYFPVLTGNTTHGSRYGLISSNDGLAYIIRSNTLYRVNITGNDISEPVVKLDALSDFEYQNGYLDRNGLLWLYGWAEIMVLDTRRDYRLLAKRTGGFVTSHYVYHGEVYMHTVHHGVFRLSADRNALVNVGEVPTYMHFFAFVDPETFVTKHAFRDIETDFILHHKGTESKITVPQEYHGRTVLTMIYSPVLHAVLVALTDGTLLLLDTETLELKEVNLHKAGIYDPFLSFEVTQSMLWITTGKGIYGLPLDRLSLGLEYGEKPVFLNQLSGLPSTNTGLNTHSFVEDTRGRTWISTSRGTLIYREDIHATNPIAPGLRVNAIYDLAGNLLHTSGPNPAILPKGMRNLRFDVSAIGFRSPDEIRLRYKIAELENPWFFTNGNTLPSFQNLEPGTYHLLLVAENISGISASEPYEFSFVIPHYVYELKSFRVFILLFGITLITGIVYYRDQNQKKRNKLLEQIVKDRTREIVLQKEETDKANEIIQKQSDDLIRLDALKNKMYANISHELRSPVTLIKGPLSQLISRHSSILPEVVRVHLERTYRNTERLEKLVEQLLDLTRIDNSVLSVHFRPVNVTKQLHWIIEAFKSYADFKKIQLLFRKPEKAVYIKADPEMLEKVFMNLLSNAVKFTGEGGTVEVDLRTKGDFTTIEFRDTGTGIPQEHIDRIFDRYYKSGNERARNTEGLGIGLSLSREFMNLMQGSISVISNPGQGTCFTLRFEVLHGRFADDDRDLTVNGLTEMPELPVPVPLEAGRFASASHTILIVDDNPDMTGFISALIAPHYSFYTAHNGKEALALLGKHEIDLVITDYMMPEFDGIFLVKAMKQQGKWKQIPVILLTAIKNEDVMLHGFQIGINDYITKPFNPNELLARTGALLRMLDKRMNARGDAEQPESTVYSFNETRINTLVDYIKANMREKLTTERLAEQLHISKKQLTRILQMGTGLNPSDFIREIRLQQARHLFETRQRGTISEVMYEVGFTHQFNFSKRYTERFGRKPADYF